MLSLILLQMRVSRFLATSAFSALSESPPYSANVLTEVSNLTLKLPLPNQPAPHAENSSYSAADHSRDVQDRNPGAVSDNEPPTKAASQKPVTPPIPANDDDSVTEAETDDETTVPQRSAGVDNVSRTSPLPDAFGSGSANRSQEWSSKPNNRKPVPTAQDDSSDTSPVKPSKKKQRVETSSDESEAGHSKLAQRKSASSSRGAKQPIKRGGRRF